MSELDHDRCKALTEKLVRVARQHFVDGPPARTAVFEVLNALAATAATVLGGAYNDPEAWRFFDEALQTNRIQRPTGRLQ